MKMSQRVILAKITVRCSDKKQAIVKAKAALGTADTKIEGSLEFVGNPYFNCRQ